MASASVALTISFSPRERKTVLELEHVHTLRLGPTDAVDVFRLMPPVPAALYPSIGAVTLDQEPRSWDHVEILQFNNSTSASLSYPPSGTVAVELTTNLGGSLGGGPALDLHYDSEEQAVIASRPFTGLVKASYTVPYFLVYLSRGGDQAQASGSLTAIYQGAMAEASFSGIQPVSPITVYSVVSQYVADEKGAWEVPPEWPEDNTYPIRSAEPLPNQDSYQQLERVHENCFLDGSGTLSVEHYTVRWEQPYGPNDASYQPVYRFDPGTPPDPDSEWKKPWDRINWASLYEAVRARYPGIQGAG